jgi:hypothetical protein
MNRQFLLPWSSLHNTWCRCLFLQPNIVIGVACKNTKICFGEAELYLGIEIPFKMNTSYIILGLSSISIIRCFLYQLNTQ